MGGWIVTILSSQGKEFVDYTFSSCPETAER